MKYLISIALCICSLFALGQTISTSQSGNGTVNAYNWPKETAFGNVYTKSTFADPYDFIQNGAATRSVSSNKLVIASSNTLSWADYLTFGQLSCISQFIYTIQFIAPTPAATSWGPGLGTHSYINTNYDLTAHVDLSNTATRGQMIISNPAGALAFNSAGSFTFSGGDLLQYQLIYSDTAASFIATDLTTSASVTLNYSYLVTTTTLFTPSTGYFALYPFGGTTSIGISYLSVTSPAVANPTVMILGDSKIKGYHASTWNGRLSYLMNAVYPTTTIHAGGSAAIFNQNSEIEEIIQQHPRQVIICSGSNDLRSPYSRSVAATAASYDSLVNSLQAAGIIVLHMPIPEDSVTAGGNYATGLTAFKNYIFTKYAGSIIDAWTPLTTSGNNRLQATYQYSDGVHTNGAAQLVMLTAIETSNQVNTSPVRIGAPQPSGYPEVIGSTIIGQTFKNRVDLISKNGGSGGTVAGSDSSIQYNNHSAFGGISNIVWNGTMVRIKGSNTTKLNISSGNNLDGLFFESAAADGGNISGGGYYDGTNWKAASATSFSNIALAGGQIAIYLNPTVTPGATITPSLQYLLSSTGATFTPPLTVTGGFGPSVFNSTVSIPTVGTTGLHFTSGTWGIQNYASINNEIMFENMQLVGGTLKYVANGFGLGHYWQNGHHLFTNAVSGTAGATVTQVVSLDLFNNLATFGVPTTFLTSTSSLASINFPAGTKKTSMVQGDVSPVSGHLWYHDGSTDYDLLAGAGLALAAANYTPTVTPSTNCSASTSSLAYYTKVGNIIHVTIRGSVTATASGTDCAFTVTLPSGTNANVSSNLGDGIVSDAAAIPAVVSGSSGTLMIIHYLPTSTSATPYGISFDYSN